MHRLLPLACLLALTLPATAAAGWGADRAQTHSGTPSGVRAAGGNGDRVALTWARRLGSSRRAEVRVGRARDGFSQAPRVLDSQAHSVEAPVATYVRNGAFAAAWRRFEGSNQRIRFRTVDRDGRLANTFNATTTGESAYFPAWVPGPSPALTWSRRTRADADELTTSGLRGVRLPVAPLSEPGAASGADGLVTVSWVHDGEVLVSDRPAPSEPFGPPITLATGPGVNRTGVVRGQGGATLVFWRDGVDLTVAARPAGGAFGPPRTVLENTTDQAQLAVTTTGEVLALAPVGDSSLVGDEQLARLGADGAPLGATQSIGRGRRAQLVADGTGAAFVAWMSEGAERRVNARRIAAGGILGTARTLAASTDPSSNPTIAATREGGAVAAWIAGGDVHARTYRP